MPARPSVVKTRHDAPFIHLATNPGEKCGLEVSEIPNKKPFGDEAFHGKLKKLLGAARKKDRKAIQESAHEILDGCVQCHSRFRN